MSNKIRNKEIRDIFEAYGGSSAGPQAYFEEVAKFLQESSATPAEYARCLRFSGSASKCILDVYHAKSQKMQTHFLKDWRPARVIDNRIRSSMEHKRVKTMLDEGKTVIDIANDRRESFFSSLRWLLFKMGGADDAASNIKTIAITEIAENPEIEGLLLGWNVKGWDSLLKELKPDVG